MALESPVVKIDDLVSTNPIANDPRSEGDDHLRNIKVAILAAFGDDGTTVSIKGAGSATGTFSPLALLDISGSSAGQIKFPATQNASSNANTLDDYEEGTFTPIVAGDSTPGSATYSVQIGVYTKVGRAVHCYAYIITSAWSGAAGNVRIEGFPFTAVGTTNNYPPFCVALSQATSFPAGTTAMTGAQVSPGATVAYPVCSGSAANAAFLAASDWKAASQIDLGGTYFT